MAEGNSESEELTSERISKLLIEAVVLFLKGTAIIALLTLAAVASMYLFAWLGPPATFIVLPIVSGLLIGWKLGERKGVLRKGAKSLHVEKPL